MTQLGKYQLVAEIARGGMGVVYLAAAHGPARFSKLLVVKELKPELVEDPTFLEMFMEEARLAARLNHVNIVQTYEIGAEGERRFIVMDYLEGVTLARIIRKKSPKFTLGMHLRCIIETLEGLSYAHSLKDFDGTPLGIVHRDATPQNVFVTFDGQVKLVDFGIAKALDSTLETRTGILKGKPAYMAPEQIAGDIDPRADVFSVGVMLWEAVAGHRMWHKKGDVEILANILRGIMPSIVDVKPEAPRAIVRIIERATAKDRDERYPSAADLAADLEAFVVTEKIDATMRDVGKVVAELFADEKQNTRDTIEKHISQLKSGKPQERLPSLRPAAPESSTPSGGKGSTTPTSDPSNPSFPANPSPPSFPSSSSLPSSPSSVSNVTPAGNEVPFAGLPSTARAGRLTLAMKMAIGCGAGLALLVGVFAMGRLNARPVAASVASSTAPKPLADPAGAAPAPKADEKPTAGATHEINVRVTPSAATIAFDGAPASNPAKKTCTQGQRITLRASLVGYAPRERELSCDQDESLELSLTPAVAVAAPPAPAPERVFATPARPAARPPPPPVVEEPTPPPARPTPAPKATDVSPTGGARPNRPIDTSSPYGN